ncbi:putative U-box domain-containing protein 53 [Raphanus sativus]|nr:putative U-box domain-containing protein 53 [Raphanus sativus]
MYEIGKLDELEFEELKLKEHATKGLKEKEIQKFEQKREAKEKEKLKESPLVAPKMQYQEFTSEEIKTATSSFSENLSIGKGAYGTVYKCNLRHTITAVKVLHSPESNLSKQFDQELEILSNIRHPHLVLLLGACREHGALVYEYLENGSLEDRLFQVNNSQPITWFVRFRIAWEVASALIFLHKSKPTPIIHRDLKPANILLDHNFVSKVGDVGISTMIQVDPLLTQLTMYKQTSPVGTLCYIDPEYQRSGRLSFKSDVYAFGMIILQLLTALPAIGLTYKVETAMENNELIRILDKNAGDWPMEKTRKLAALALSCTEIRAKDRPDLETQILPTLESFKNGAENARNLISLAQKQPPSHFLCPLLKDVMSEPCVASDGYTYDRRAIEEWMEDRRTSPVTNLPLQNTNLLPNHSVYAAIVEWRHENQQGKQKGALHFSNSSF